MNDEWDLVGYVRRSQYRKAVVGHLAEFGDALPSEIAAETGYALSHVSRALSQLRDRDLVRLLVSEDRHRGRIYGLTDCGRAVARRMQCDVALDWDVVDVDAFRHPALAAHLEESLGSALHVLACRAGDVGEMAPVGDPDGEVRPLWVRTLLAPPDPDLVSRADARYRYAVRGVADATVVQLVLSEDEHVALTIDDCRSISVPSFVERCFDALG